ncbi:hypothetical protein OV208_18460 [Corallococcus sp. bb12-1]|uniref:hypothetical protein n=1 Tax=Corallococcus sp. bb12-1 TaxID=2996784 RepID=UPI00226DB4E4|nr:hypothetical protein [Corallococcus sp. bb12-1]MCY1043306.1 hypothetical protein [Corallococcus sp. bb12-1]
MSACPTPRGAHRKKGTRPKREPTAPMPEDVAPVPTGMVRLLSGQLVTEADARQVLPGPLPPEARWPTPPDEPDAAPSLQPALHLDDVSMACPDTHELDWLRAELARRDEALVREREHAATLARALESQARALAGLAPVLAVPRASRPSVPVAVPQVVPPVPGDMSPSVPWGQGDMKGGRGEAATTASKAEKKREYERKKKQRQREKKRAAAENAREVSPVPCPPVPGDMSPAVPHGDMSPPASVPVPPVVRKARPKWMEDDAPSPDKVFFAWAQEERGKRFPGAIPEAPPSAWAGWYAEALAAVGGAEQRLRAAWLAWLEDAWGQARQPVCPARAFLGAEVWRRHVPGQDVPAAPATSSGPVLPDTPAGSLWGQVLSALRGSGKAYAATQLARLSPALDGDLLVLEAPDKFAAAALTDDYLSLIEATLEQLAAPVRSVLIHTAAGASP